MNYFLSNFVSPVELNKIFLPHGLFPPLIDMNTRGKWYGLNSLSRNSGKRKQKMREEVSQAMTYNYFLGYNNVVSDLCFPAFGL